MIDSANQRNIPVLLIGVPSFGVLFLESNEIYNEVAEKYALLYDGEVLPRVESDPELKSDRIHPNAGGYRQMAMAVYELLQDSGALNQGVSDSFMHVIPAKAGQKRVAR